MSEQVSEDEAAIRANIEAWMEATRAGRPGDLKELIDDDALFMVPGVAPFGKDILLAMYDEMNDRSIEGSCTIEELEIIGEQAWLRNYIDLVVTMADGTAVKRAGQALTIMRKGTDGHWRLLRDANLVIAVE